MLEHDFPTFLSSLYKGIVAEEEYGVITMIYS